MKNLRQPLYLSAREAAGELSVSMPTLYAYVSRGFIRSEPDAGSRARRYRAEDVRALRNRRSHDSSSLPEAAPALDSAVSTLTEAGPVYRGVSAVALAGSGTLEQAATLLWDANDADPFAASNLPVIDELTSTIMSASAAAAPLARAVAALSVASDADPRAFNRSAEGRVLIGARAMRLIAAAILGADPSAQPLHRQVAQAWTPGERSAEDLFRRALVLLADHELNASTWTVRCAASTGLNLYDALIAGLVALKGPKHGGAGPLAGLMAADLAAGDVAAKVREKVALGDRIPGFGHPIYKHGDARAAALLAALNEAGADPRLAVEAPALFTEATGLHPNIDYALAVMMHMFGLATGHETALFAIARSAGWVAHAIEQLHSGALIRPRARYVGPAPR